MSISIVILAAGQGKRMCSDKPKVLHQLAGKPLLSHVLQVAISIDARETYVVYGHEGKQVLESIKDYAVTWIKQKTQKGTGDAIKQVINNIPETDDVLILYGDVPLITKKTLNSLIKAGDSGFSILTAKLSKADGYGRIVRSCKGNVESIVEEKDADHEQKRICEINTGFMCVRAKYLKKWISSLKNNNNQKEYYLTDIVKKAVIDKVIINSVLAESDIEIKGINNRMQLAELERYYQFKQACDLMNKGVSFSDPKRFDLRGKIETGKDNLIDINVIFEGNVRLGNNVKIGANSYIKDSTILDNVVIFPNTMIDNAVIGSNCRIGPFARIRPETTLDNNVHIGNFVELKKTYIKKESKVNHLSYIGDSDVGGNVNIGAGTITCNYDGVNKHKTTIGDNVFIGSDVQLIAPVNISSGATIAAGTTVTKDVVKDSLAIARKKQILIDNWKRPDKK